MKTATLGLLAIAAVLAGCASDVDKCMAAWEDANKDVPDDHTAQFCDGICNDFNKPVFTKGQARYRSTLRCMEAAKGE